MTAARRNSKPPYDGDPETVWDTLRGSGGGISSGQQEPVLRLPSLRQPQSDHGQEGHQEVQHQQQDVRGTEEGVDQPQTEPASHEDSLRS